MRGHLEVANPRTCFGVNLVKIVNNQMSESWVGGFPVSDPLQHVQGTGRVRALSALPTDLCGKVRDKQRRRLVGDAIPHALRFCTSPASPAFHAEPPSRLRKSSVHSSGSGQYAVITTGFGGYEQTTWAMRPRTVPQIRQLRPRPVSG